MKESTARIGDGHHHHDDRTGSECFPCRWPEINKRMSIFRNGNDLYIFDTYVILIP